MDFWPGYLPLGNFRIGSLLELEDSLQEESGVCRIVVILSSCTPTAMHPSFVEGQSMACLAERARALPAASRVANVAISKCPGCT